MLSQELKERTDKNITNIDRLAEELVKAREALSQERAIAALASERFRHTFYMSPIAKAIVCPDGTWLEVNNKLCELLGRTREELKGTKFQDVTRVEDIREDERLVGEMLSGELDKYKMPKAYIRKPDGEEVWVGLYVTLIRSAGEPLYFVSQIISEDIATEVLEFINESRREESIGTREIPTSGV